MIAKGTAVRLPNGLKQTRSEITYKKDSIPVDNTDESGYISINDEQDSTTNKGNRKPIRDTFPEINNIISDSQFLKFRQQAQQLLLTGQITQSLNMFETIIFRKAQVSGIESPQFLQYFQQLLKQLCDQSMKNLQKQEFNRSLQILFRCEQLTSPGEKFETQPIKRILTYNNIGCTYRRMGQLKKALVYLQKAETLVRTKNCKQNAGMTYLNICAVASQIGDHQKAKLHAQRGVEQCQNQLSALQNDPSRKNNPNLLREKVKFLGIAFHNMGVEEDFFENYEEALSWYQQAYELLQTQLGPEDPLAIKFQNSFNNCLLKKNKRKSVINKDGEAQLQGGPKRRPGSSATTGSLRPKSALSSIQPLSSKNQTAIGFKQNSMVNPEFAKTTQIQGSGKGKFFDESQAEAETPPQNRQGFAVNNFIIKPGPSSIRSSGSLQSLRSSGRFNNDKKGNLSRNSNKDLNDLEQIGLLDWTDSENERSVDQDRFREQRLKFLKNLNQYDKQEQKKQDIRQVEDTQKKVPFVPARKSLMAQIIERQKIQETQNTSVNNAEVPPNPVVEPIKPPPEEVKETHVAQTSEVKEKRLSFLDQKRGSIPLVVESTTQDKETVQNKNEDSEIIEVKSRKGSIIEAPIAEQQESQKKVVQNFGKKNFVPFLNKAIVQVEKEEEEQERIKREQEERKAREQEEARIKKEEQEKRVLEEELRRKQEQERLRQEIEQQKLKQQLERSQRISLYCQIFEQYMLQRLNFFRIFAKCEKEMVSRAKAAKLFIKRMKAAIQIQRFVRIKLQIIPIKKRLRVKRQTSFLCFKIREMVKKVKIIQRFLKMKYHRRNFLHKRPGIDLKKIQLRTPLRKVRMIDRQLFIEKDYAIEEEFFITVYLSNDGEFLQVILTAPQKGKRGGEKQLVPLPLYLNLFQVNYDRKQFLQQAECLITDFGDHYTMKRIILKLMDYLYVLGGTTIHIENITDVKDLDENQTDIEQRLMKPSFVSMPQQIAEQNMASVSASRIQRWYQKIFNRKMFKLYVDKRIHILKTYFLKVRSGGQIMIDNAEKKEVEGDQSPTKKTASGIGGGLPVKNLMDQEYLIKANIIVNQISKDKFIKASIDGSSRKNFNSLLIPPRLEQMFQDLRHEIMETVDFYISEGEQKIDYCREIKELIYDEGQADGYFKKDKESVQVFSQADQKKIIIIQKFVRLSNIREKFFLLINQMKEKRERKEWPITSRFVQSKINPSSNNSNVSFFILNLTYCQRFITTQIGQEVLQSKQRTLKITAFEKNRVGVGKNDIVPFKQTIFESTSYKDILFYAPGMLERGEIVAMRNGMGRQIMIPRLEDVMAEVRQNLKKASGQSTQTKHHSIESRVIFNTMRIRGTFFMNPSVVTLSDFRSDLLTSVSYKQEKEAEEDAQDHFYNDNESQQFNTQYAELIKKSFRNYKFRREEKIEMAKGIRVNEDLHHYAYQIMPITEGVVDFIKDMFGGGIPGVPKEEPIKEIIIQATKPQVEGEEIIRSYKRFLFIEETKSRKHNPGSASLDHSPANTARDLKPLSPLPTLAPKKSDQTLLKSMIPTMTSKSKTRLSFEPGEEPETHHYEHAQVDNLVEQEKDVQEVTEKKENQDHVLIEDLEDTRAKDEFDFDVVFDNKFKQIVVAGLKLNGKKESHNLIIKQNDLHLKEFSTREVRMRLDELIFDRIHYNGHTMFYKEPQDIEKKRKEQADRDLLEREQQKSSTVPLLSIIKLDFEFSFSINIANMTIYLTIMAISDSRLVKEYQFLFSAFDSPNLYQIVELQSTEELQRFFEYSLSRLVNLLELQIDRKSRQLGSNFWSVLPNLPEIFRNQFSIVLQRYLFMKRIFKRYRVKLATSTKKELFLQTETLCLAGNNFLRAHFFLEVEKFTVKIVVHKQPFRSGKAVNRKVYQIYLLQLSENLTKSWRDMPGTKRKIRLDGREDPQFLMEKKWIDITGLHHIEYFREVMKPLIHWIINNCYFNILYEKAIVEPSDKRIPMEEEKQKKNARGGEMIDGKIVKSNTIARDQFFALVMCVSRLQRAFKNVKTNEWLTMKKERKEELNRQYRTIGERLRRAFKKIGEQIYVINVYKRNEIYTFELIDYLDKDNKMRLRAVYQYNKNKLYNTRQKTLIEYLIDQIEVDGQSVTFRDNYFVDIGQLQPPLRHQEVEAEEKKTATKALDSLISDQNISVIQEMSQHEEEVKAEASMMERLEEIGFQEKSTAVSNLVDYVFTKDEDLGREVLYNVVYTGRRPKMTQKRPAGSQQQQEEAENPITQIENDEESNTVRINVDLNELKKLYPTIDPKSTGLMKLIGEQLINGIQIGSDGKLLVDGNKININCMTDVEKKMQDMKSNGGANSSEPLRFQRNSEDEKGMGGQPPQNTEQLDSKTILVKSTRFFNQNKYLILIYLVERKVKQIIKATNDTVFEEYEMLYQVYSLNLSLKVDVPLIWEISPQEIKGNIEMVTTGSDDHVEYARYIMRRLQIFNSHYIFSVETNDQFAAMRPNPVVVVFCEKGLQPIQVHFQSRRYRQNYQEFQKQVQMKLSKLVMKFIPKELRSVRQYFLLAVFDAQSKWQFIAWDMVTYERFYLEVEKVKFQRFFLMDKKQTIESISRYMDIDTTKGIISINDSGAVDYLDQTFSEGKFHQNNSK